MFVYFMIRYVVVDFEGKVSYVLCVVLIGVFDDGVIIWILVVGIYFYSGIDNIGVLRV